MKFEKIDDVNRNLVNDFLMEHWYSTIMVIRGNEIDLKEANGFFVSEGESIIGLITYLIYGKTIEVTSLDSLQENHGIGTKLIEMVVQEAKEQECERIILVTTNDNINAIKFYQKRGFDMVQIFRNAVSDARKIKPDIPLIGENSIPLRHEIEFERLL